MRCWRWRRPSWWLDRASDAIPILTRCAVAGTETSDAYHYSPGWLTIGLSPVGPIPGRPTARHPSCPDEGWRCRFWLAHPTPARNSASIVARSLTAQARQSARSLAQSTTCTCSEAIARTHRHDQDRPDSITRPAGAVQASGPSIFRHCVCFSRVDKSHIHLDDLCSKFAF